MWCFLPLWTFYTNDKYMNIFIDKKEHQMIIKRILSAFIMACSLHATAACEDFAIGGKFPKPAEPTMILCKHRFAVGFSEDRKVPLWTAHVLTASQVGNKSTEFTRTPFKQDPAVDAQKQAQLTEYAETGYDRGHMVPFDDVNDEAASAAESMYLTNIVPQAAKNNRGVWKSLETKIRILVSNKKNAYIITGVFFSNYPKKLLRGTNVPDSMWKMVFIPETREIMVVVIPNKNSSSDSLPEEFILKTREDILASFQAYGNPVPGLDLTSSDLKIMKSF